MVEKFSNFKFMRLKTPYGILPIFLLNHMVVTTIISVKSKQEPFTAVTLSADVSVRF